MCRLGAIHVQVLVFFLMMQSACGWQTMRSEEEQRYLELKQSPTTSTSSKGFFERMSDSLTQVVVGWIIVIFSVPVIWFNERQDARMSALRSYARKEVRTVSADKADPDNHHWLVHVQGGQMTSAAPIKDAVFDVEFKSDCLRLRHTCEVFQVIEHKHTEEKEKLGGGKETITTYTYSETWSQFWHDSSRYHNVNFNKNTVPAGLENGLGVSSYSCQRVEFGQGFLLGDLVDQCDAFSSAAGRLSDSIHIRGGTAFKKVNGMFYYNQAGSSPENPQVGDARVNIEYVPDGIGTVLALQAEVKDDDRSTFIPYRLVPHGFCGINEHDLKAKLWEEGLKTRSDLAAEDGCPGILACVCCACHVTAKLFAAFFTAEMYSVFHGDLKEKECLSRIEKMQSLQTLVLRLLGWLMMFIGLYMTFAPLLTLINALPFIGPFLSKMGGWVIWILCLVVTLVFACIIASFAYLVYRPLLALVYMTVAGLIVGAVMVLSAKFNK